MRVGFYQFRPLFAKPAANIRRIISALESIEADLVVLPELALSGYYFRDAEEAYSLAESPHHSVHIERLVELCHKKNRYIVLGFAEREGQRCFNSAALLGPQGVIHIYRKLHLFNEEKRCMSPGDTPLQVNEIMGVKIGIMICFDWVFPEVARTLALQGAEILCHPSNLVLGFCQQVMLARCLENRVFAITANRFGKDVRPHGSLRFTGKSQIVSPEGALICRAASQREQIKVVEIHPSKAQDKSITRYNQLFSDRRPDFYGLA